MRKLVILLSVFVGLVARTLEERKEWISQGIEGVIAHSDPTALVGVKVVSLDQGVTLYERNSRARFVPASSLKLFTAGAALDRLGADYRFETKVMRDGFIEGGILKGNCYLVGSGDPSLKGLDLLELVQGLTIKEIKGDLVLDVSCFEDGPMGPGWMWDEEPDFWCVPMSALNLEHNFVEGIVIQEPEKLVASLFKGLLDRKGILLRGKLRLGQVPEGSICLVRHESEPLGELIKPVLQDSDNLYANCIFKKLGGSWDKGREAVEGFLKKAVGLEPKEMCILDGSGESRYNLVSPEQMISFLEEMRSNHVLRDALPVGGASGTLKKRMAPFGGKVIAKTGCMTGVSSICGYVKTGSGEELAIALFVNGYVKNGREIKVKLEDEICHILVNSDF
ncbi:MAG: D-alanyl-D-alanine carboxypeptidase/D-alanyl-D-alanine-endopeptidase [Chlamydiia bacterium]|nr:D-alanyl-D-alanine carboxypeptidase/D-alanyl-D-alanine-endopeptidase [Chlamydiia bacterium]